MKRTGRGLKAGCTFVLLSVLAACAREAKPPLELPQLMSDSTPFVYPLDLWDNRTSGEVVLLLRVSEHGVVDSALVAKSSGYDEFDSAAVRGARQLRFTPAKQGERRRATWTKLPVQFTRDTLKMGLDAK